MEYRAIPGLPGYYASSLGDIWTRDRLMVPVSHDGLKVEIQGREYWIDRLVLEAWTGPGDPEDIAWHRFGQAWDHRPENLDWLRPMAP